MPRRAGEQLPGVLLPTAAAAAGSVAQLLPLAPLQPPSSPFPAPLLLLWVSPGSRSTFQLLEPAEAALSLVINPAAAGCAPVSGARGGSEPERAEPTRPGGLRARGCLLLRLWGRRSDGSRGKKFAVCGSRKTRGMGIRSVLPAGEKACEPPLGARQLVRGQVGHLACGQGWNGGMCVTKGGLRQARRTAWIALPRAAGWRTTHNPISLNLTLPF